MALNKCQVYNCNFRNYSMPATGYTVSELAEKTKKSIPAIQSWLSRHNIKPLSYEAIYPPDILDKIKDIKRGRPPKPKKA